MPFTNQFYSGTQDSEDYPDGFETPIDDDYYLDCNSIYSDLDQIKDKMDSIPPYCMNQYIVDAEISIMDDALSQFNDLVNNGYNEKFSIYEEYTIEQVPVQINAFMGNGHADDYFKCKEYSYISRCSSCRYATCNENCDNSSGCQTGYGYHKVTCPTVYQDGADGIDLVQHQSSQRHLYAARFGCILQSHQRCIWNRRVLDKIWRC